MKATEFLRALFGDAKEGSIALWRSDTKATSWAKPGDDRAIDKFCKAVNATPADGYFGVGLQTQRAAGRGMAADVIAIPGLWADIDFAGKPNDGKPNAKKNYPSPEVAEQAVASMPAAPTLRVITGGGVHVYWLFDQLFTIASDADRQRAAAVVQGWQGMLKARLLKLGGFGLDSTHDLARVLRIPGTVHTKHPGKLVSVDPPAGELVRYKFDAFEGFLQAGSLLAPAATSKKAAPAPKAAAAAPAVVYASETSEPPAVKLSNLLAASPEFAAFFTGKKTKPSPSEYDMVFANYAVNAGWSDQEAAALLVSFARSRQPEHVAKLLRVTNGVQDYLKLTIGKAHDKRVTDASTQQVDEAIDQLAVEVRAAGKEGRDVSREVVLSNVSQFLGVQVTGFRQTGRQEEVYSLLIKQGTAQAEIIIGGAAAIHSSPQKVCERIMAEAGKFVSVSPKLRKEWGAIISGLISIREFHDVQEAEISDRVRSLIEELLSRNSGGYHAPESDSQVKQAIAGKPFIADGKLYVAGQSLKKLAGEVDKGIAGSSLYIGLKQIGFAQVTIQIPSRKTSKSYWSGPAEGFGISAPPDPTPLSADGARSNAHASPPQHRERRPV